MLSDFPDAAAEHMPGDDEILQAAGRNRSTQPAPGNGQSRSLLPFSPRPPLEPAGIPWIGWERKRGKIEEFNRLLRGAGDTSFRHVAGDLSILPEVRYCITLDSDTRLPRDAARKLIGIILHPLNQPRVDPAAAARHRGLRHPAAARQRDHGERGRIALRACLCRPYRR